MIRHAWVVFLLLAVAGRSAFADGGTGLAVGFQAGAGFNRYSVSSGLPPDAVQGTEMGAIVGGQVEVKITDAVYVQPGMRLDQRIHKQISGVGDQRTDLKATANFIELSTLLKLKPFATSVIRPYGYFGPGFGVNFMQSLRLSVGGVEHVMIPEGTFKLSPFDITLNGGAGLEADVATDFAVFVQGGYSMGLLNAVSQPKDFRMKSRAPQVVVGIFMGF